MPLVRDPYMVIFKALDMLVMASPYVRLNWSYWVEVSTSFDDVSGVVSDCIQNDYDMALAQVEQIIVQGGYDRELSASPYVRLNWSYWVEVSMPNAVKITDWSNGWMVQTAY